MTSVTTPLVGADLLARIAELKQERPEIESRQELAKLCGYGSLKRDLTKFNAAYIDAAGGLPPIGDNQSKYDVGGREHYTVNKGGIVCVRRNWLAKLGAKRGDTIGYKFNPATNAIELTLVAKAAPALVPAPVAAEVTAPAPSLAPVAPATTPLVPVLA